MKVCPVCKTTLFEDMEVCYGCMYHFGSDPELEKRMEDEARDVCQGTEAPSALHDSGVEKDSSHAALHAQNNSLQSQEPNLNFTDDEQLWIVRFEVRHGSDKSQVWSAEATLPLRATQKVSLPSAS